MAGQSLVEFALASVVLVLLFGGLVDLTRAIHFADVLQGAAREGARSGAAYSAGSTSNPGLYDLAIKAVVDAQLNAGGLPSSILKNPGIDCPAVADGNGFHNPPYASAAFPGIANQPWLYICYDNTGLDFLSTPATGYAGRDLNVVLVMAYGPLTAVVTAPLGGNLGLATSVHTRIQGG
ncbi:MAG: pilus assembly protein [Candidatus Dormibacteraeota bacterium]|nr:pilus assembly protein [Candidatus Dormibacteraeota bacterium]